MGDAVKSRQIRSIDELQVLKTGPIMKLDETDLSAVAIGFDPTLDHDLFFGRKFSL
jgi:hypothetical protein